MKIGIDGRLWNETGVGRYIRNLVRELQVLDKKNDYVLFVRRGVRKIEFGIRAKNWKIVEANIRWHSVEEQLKFASILNRENLDLVHFPYFSIPVNYKKPYVITIHDLILNHFPTGKATTLPKPFYQFKRLGYKYVLSKAIKNAEKIIVPLEAVKKDLIKTMKVDEDKIAVTYEGVDEGIRGETSKGKASASRLALSASPYFLYVGNAYPHKNLDRLIDGFRLLRDSTSSLLQNENLSLILVGKDDYFYMKIAQRIEKEKIGGVLIKNDVSDEELSALYQNAVALVAPSLMEGFGLPVLEAMSNKCLVVASDIPSFREVTKDVAIYFDPYSSRDIQNKMNLVFDLDEKSKKLKIGKGINRAKAFSWREMTIQTLKLYNSIK